MDGIFVLVVWGLLNLDGLLLRVDGILDARLFLSPMAFVVLALNEKSRL
jgi:hypothetical protein